MPPIEIIAHPPANLRGDYVHNFYLAIKSLTIRAARGQTEALSA